MRDDQSKYYLRGSLSKVKKNQAQNILDFFDTQLYFLIAMPIGGVAATITYVNTYKQISERNPNLPNGIGVQCTSLFRAAIVLILAALPGLIIDIVKRAENRDQDDILDHVVSNELEDSTLYDNDLMIF